MLSWIGGDSRWEGAPDIQVLRDAKGREIATALDSVASVEAARSCFLLSHPRVLIESVPDMVLALGFYVREAGLKRSGAKPIYVMHVREPLEGGLSDLERSALNDVARKCGAGRVFVSTQAEEMHAPDVLALAKGRRGSQQSGVLRER